MFPRQCLPCVLGENAPAPNADVSSSLDPEEMATSARSGGLANFRSDGDKSRHPCKESPEDSQAAFVSGYTRYSRWQSPQKSIIFSVLYLERQDMLSRLPIYHLHITHYHISRNYTCCENSVMPHIFSLAKLYKICQKHDWTKNLKKLFSMFKKKMKLEYDFFLLLLGPTIITIKKYYAHYDAKFKAMQ